ncbi:hypothetical protein FOMPIDRAFT_92121 [Fomitopsis schrenkii]|uniref:C2H2-type domain-containing protein n=1 Tax=Fomitopsis schrenkii TaxID=2126942 RepID=S8FFV2_FOMSC|nr:hypothetical protein FOMPIDRAFT_92121 [Fomitopsis schrenkii]
MNAPLLSTVPIPFLLTPLLMGASIRKPVQHYTRFCCTTQAAPLRDASHPLAQHLNGIIPTASPHGASSECPQVRRPTGTGQRFPCDENTNGDEGGTSASWRESEDSEGRDIWDDHSITAYLSSRSNSINMPLTLAEIYDLAMYVLKNDQEVNLPAATEVNPPALPPQSDIRTYPSSSREQADRLLSENNQGRLRLGVRVNCYPDSSAYEKMRAYAPPITQAQRPEPVAPETIYDVHICSLLVAGGKRCGQKGSTEAIWAHIRAEHGVPAHVDQPEVGACDWGGCTERGLPLDLLKHWQQVHKSAVFQEYRGDMKTIVRCKLCAKEERKGSKPPTLKYLEQHMKTCHWKTNTRTTIIVQSLSQTIDPRMLMKPVEKAAKPAVQKRKRLDDDAGERTRHPQRRKIHFRAGDDGIYDDATPCVNAHTVCTNTATGTHRPDPYPIRARVLVDANAEPTQHHLPRRTSTYDAGIAWSSAQGRSDRNLIGDERVVTMA